MGKSQDGMLEVIQYFPNTRISFAPVVTKSFANIVLSAAAHRPQVQQIHTYYTYRSWSIQKHLQTGADALGNSKSSSTKGRESTFMNTKTDSATPRARAPPPRHLQRSNPGLWDDNVIFQENVFQNNVTMHLNPHLCFLEAGFPANITERCSLSQKSPYVKLGS